MEPKPPGFALTHFLSIELFHNVQAELLSPGLRPGSGTPQSWCKGGPRLRAMPWDYFPSIGLVPDTLKLALQQLARRRKKSGSECAQFQEEEWEYCRLEGSIFLWQAELPLALSCG